MCIARPTVNITRQVVPLLKLMYQHWHFTDTQNTQFTLSFTFFFFKYIYFIEVQLTYNVSGPQQCDSVIYIYIFIYIHTHTHTIFQIIFHYSLLQDIDYSSLLRFTLGVIHYMGIDKSLHVNVDMYNNLYPPHSNIESICLPFKSSVLLFILSPFSPAPWQPIIFLSSP